VFTDIVDYLRPGDALVVNDARVIRARLFGRRSTGGRVEVLLVRRDESAGEDVWEAMLSARGKLRDGERIAFSENLSAELLGRDDAGRSLVRLLCDGDADSEIERLGRVPLPPYIKRPTEHNPYATADAERYQTVYARHPGAVAAPTAGLHFTAELLRRIREAGCRLVTVTLYVGPGTFKPVRTDSIKKHSVDREYYRMSSEAAAAVNAADRVVAVGTTTTRVLETVAAETDGALRAAEGWTDLFIHPPYRFRVVDALVTNFHLPRSSLLMLAAAFAGRRRILAAYDEAKRRSYRFYSYGDATLIL
jgi:S-adenosylmethionine:tRNA ribosyltransferase-isomerase